MQLNVVTVIPTFFDESNNVDIIQIKKHINKQIESGIQTIVILGTTSEAPTLTLEEKIMIINSVYDDFKDKVSIIVGVGGVNGSNGKYGCGGGRTGQGGAGLILIASW
jgi:dihydrodipicolinate synthase/N-acetylneuraminate lyase